MNRAKRFLVVDDDRRNRSLLQAMLKSLGHESDVACTGMEALVKARQGFDMVLLDVMMPGIDGFETARRFRDDAGFSDIPIIMVTALGDKEARLRAVKAGANDFMSKPIDKVELEIRSAALLKRKEVRDTAKEKLCEMELELEERAAALRKARLEITQAQHEVFEVQVEAIYCLARAAECRDLDVGAHIQRTQALSAFLAKKLELPAEDVIKIFYAAPLHDVGKIGVPDRILLKQGRLTDDEYEIMKSHTTKGAEMIGESLSGVFEVAKEIALCHHERWDGRGYPNGLVGEQIPLSARIVSVVDAFDAITSTRPYQQSRSIGEAYEIIGNQRGRQFDCRVVGAFLANRDMVMEIQRQSDDKPVELLGDPGCWEISKTISIGGKP
jgi:putative two-component system response regulator